MGVAVWISLLSCIRAEIYVNSYQLPVTGRHLCFTTYPDIGQHYQQFIPVVWPRKHGCSRWNVFAIMFTSWDIRNFLSTSGQWPPSLLYDIPRHRTALIFSTVCFMALKTRYYLWNCVAMLYISWYSVITHFQPPSWIYHFRFHLGVLPKAPLKSLIPKT